MTPMQLWRFHQLQFNYIFQSKSEIKHSNNLNKNKVMKNKRNNAILNSDTNEVSHILGSEEWNCLDLENLGKSRDSHSTDQKWLKVDTTNAPLPKTFCINIDDNRIANGRIWTQYVYESSKKCRNQVSSNI